MVIVRVTRLDREGEREVQGLRLLIRGAFHTGGQTTGGEKVRERPGDQAEYRLRGSGYGSRGTQEVN